MKMKWFKMTVVAAAVCGLGGLAHAQPINGTLTLDGEAHVNGNLTALADFTGPSGTGSPAVTADTGTFSSIGAGAQATFASSLLFSSGAVSDLFSVGGFTYNLISSSLAVNSSGAEITGTGTISGNGFVSTPAALAIAISGILGAGLQVGLQVTTTAGGTGSVPDGGTTAMLLGAGVLGLGLMKRYQLA